MCHIFILNPHVQLWDEGLDPEVGNRRFFIAVTMDCTTSGLTEPETGAKMLARIRQKIHAVHCFCESEKHDYSVEKTLVITVWSISSSDPDIKNFSFAGLWTTISINNLKDKCEKEILESFSSFLLSFWTVIAGDGIYTFPVSIEENAIVPTGAWANIIQFYILCYVCRGNSKVTLNNFKVNKPRK